MIDSLLTGAPLLISASDVYDGAGIDLAAPLAPSSKDWSDKEFNEALNAQVPDNATVVHGFCVATTSKKLRRLHFVNSCGKVPGKHYKHFICYGDVSPEDGDFDKKCVDCFGKEGIPFGASLNPDSDVSDSGSPSS